MNDVEIYVQRVHGLTREQVLRQLAEESSELTQAALKLIRAMEDTTPVCRIETRLRILQKNSETYRIACWYWKSTSSVLAFSRKQSEKRR